MDALKTNWMASLNGDVAAQAIVEKREQQKQALIGKIASDRERHSKALYEGGSQTMVDKKGKKQKTIDYERHDQTGEFDVDEVKDGYHLADPEKLGAYLDTVNITESMRREMEAAMTDEVDDDGKPVYPLGEDGQPLPGATPKQKRLFSDEEIAAEVYDPMKRRGLLPETMVPDKYSRTKEMLDASFGAYGERLKRDKKSLGKRLFSENIGLARTVISSGFTIGSSANSLAGLKGGDPNDSVLDGNPKANIASMQEKLAKGDEGTRLAFTGQALSFSNDVAYEGGTAVGEKVIDRLTGKPVEQPERVKAAGALTVALVASVSGELGVPFAASGLAMEVSATFGNLVDRKAISAKFAAETFDAEAVAAIGRLLGAACKATLLKLDPAVDTSTGLLTTAGGAIETALGRAPAAGPVVTAVNDVKFEIALKAFGAAAARAAGDAVGQPLLTLFARDDFKDKLLLKAADAMEEAFTAQDDAVSADDVDSHKVITSHKPNWVKGGAGSWVCATCESTDDENPEVFAGLIEAKINRLKRDQDLLKWGSTLVGMGIDVAANFIAPLAIAGCALKIAKNLYEAGKRTRDLIAFYQSREAMFNAASPFSAAVSQFMENASVQQAHYYANAAFEAAKMIGAIIQCTGAMAAPAGAAVSGAASIAQAIEAVLYEVGKRLALESAWIQYKLALTRPENRKLGLLAVKNNPTLAKYAVAWGAVVKKDAIVGDFIDYCGLTPETLKDEAAGIDKVVEYLELRMPDDNVVTGRGVDNAPSSDWAPAKLELTVDSWLLTKGLAEKKGGVVPQDTRSLELALRRHAQAFAVAKAAADLKPPTVTAQAQTACLQQLSALPALINETRTLRTETAGGMSSPEMANVLKRYVALVREREEVVEGWPVPATATV